MATQYPASEDHAADPPIFRWVALSCGLVCGAIGGVVLFGWTFGVQVLCSILPGAIDMQPITALSFIALGGSLALAARRRLPPALGLVCAGLVGAGAVHTLLQYLFAVGLDVDHWFFATAVDHQSTPPRFPGRMADGAAVSFLALSIALGSLSWRRLALKVECYFALSLAPLIIAITSLMGYLLNVRSLRGVLGYTDLALHTGLGLVLMSVGVGVMRPDAAAMRVLAGKGTGAAFLRRLLPVILLLPMACAWLALQGSQAAWYPVNFRLVLMTLVTSISLSALTFVFAARMERNERERSVEAAEHAAQLNAESARLRSSQSRLQAMINNAYQAIIVVDERGVVTDWNRQAETTFGWSGDEAIGRPLTDLIIPPRNRKAYREDMSRYMATGRAVLVGNRAEITARHKDGVEIPVELALSAAQGPDGWIFTALMHDISTRKAAQDALKNRAAELEALTQQLEAAKASAEAASSVKSDFLARMSHELRTPLNGIIGFADLLASEDQPEEIRREYLRYTRDSGRALLNLVNDILDFSKIEAGKMQLERTQVDIDHILRGCEALVRHEAQAKGLDLRAGATLDMPRFVMGDPTRLRQVLLNLTVNAVKFTQAGGVELRAAMAKGPGGLKLRFEVIDSGIGISAEAQARLFQDFAQVDASTTRQYGGTGLGLAISKRLVALMDGVIGVDSLPGVGSTFWFEIPFETAQALGEVAEPLKAPAARPLRILVAEDLEMNQILARAILTKAGHSVDVVGDGAQAVAAAQLSAYDLILMDLHMPVMDGLEAAETIRCLPGSAAETPIWAMTADALAEHVEASRAAGMNGHVSKPLDANRLLAQLAQIDAAEPVRMTVAPPSSQPPQRAVLNPAALEDLRGLMGEARLAGMVFEFLDEMAATLRAIEADPKDRSFIDKETHKMVSMAGNFGFEQLSDHSRVVMNAARADDDLNGVLKALYALAAAAVGAAESRWPNRDQAA